MLKLILVFAVLVGAFYTYVTQDIELKAKTESDILAGKVGGLKGKLTGLFGEKGDVEEQIKLLLPVRLDTTLLTIYDTQGEKLAKNDVKVRIYNGNTSVADSYLDANSQVRVQDIQTLTPYRVVAEEGYGMARLYPHNGNIQFASTGATVQVQRRAIIKPLSFSENATEYGRQVNLTSGKHLLLFGLKSEGRGIVRRPSIVLSPIEKPATFKGWIWAYQDLGLGLPQSLQKETLNWDTRYQFDRDLSLEAYGIYILQIENVTEGKFDFCVYDDINLERQCAKFIIS